MMNSSETFGNNRNAEAVRDPGMMFGNTHLSFSNFEIREFEPQRPNETEREFAEREMRTDERLFMVGLMAAETRGVNGMIAALVQPDFKVKRSQMREFKEAIGRMSEDEYAKRIDSVMGAFTNEESRQTALDIADYYWISGKQLVEDDAVQRTHHRKPRKFEWKAKPVEPRVPERPITQAEVMLNNPARYYREQKQERRGQRFLNKVKEAFDRKFKKEEKIPRRVRSGVDPSDYSERKGVPTPQTDLAQETRGRQRFEEPVFNEPANERPVMMSRDGIHELMPAGRPRREGNVINPEPGSGRPEGGYFRDTNFYQESQPGRYFGEEAQEVEQEPVEAVQDVWDEAQEPSAEGSAEPEPYVGKHTQRVDRGPLHTNDFSFGEEGAF